MSRNRNKQNRKRVIPQFKVKTPIPTIEDEYTKAWTEFAKKFVIPLDQKPK